MQLAFFDTNVPRKAKRQAERYMRGFNNLEAVIESKKLELEPTMTTNYAPSESQRGNQFHSETERITYVRMTIQDYERQKKKLDLIRKSLHPTQLVIWDERYIMERSDTDIYLDNNIPKRTYYRLKGELIAIVADAFGLIQDNENLGTNLHQS
ncbi:hypothetical protein P4639_14440 [Priestia megaterium]|uniref:hypothetical protein n=1 Tax=Priestia megaterium TaxID=1404 RepID=UPI002E21E0BB|nr:hypothetical protein [Priestia megaterium]